MLRSDSKEAKAEAEEFSKNLEKFKNEFADSSKLTDSELAKLGDNLLTYIKKQVDRVKNHENPYLIPSQKMPQEEDAMTSLKNAMESFKGIFRDHDKLRGGINERKFGDIDAWKKLDSIETELNNHIFKFNEIRAKDEQENEKINQFLQGLNLFLKEGEKFSYDAKTKNITASSIHAPVLMEMMKSCCRTLPADKSQDKTQSIIHISDKGIFSRIVQEKEIMLRMQIKDLKERVQPMGIKSLGSKDRKEFSKKLNDKLKAKPLDKCNYKELLTLKKEIVEHREEELKHRKEEQVVNRESQQSRKNIFEKIKNKVIDTVSKKFRP